MITPVMSLRRLLFNAVTFISATVLRTHEVLSNGFRLVVAGLSLKLMWLLDPETMKEHQEMQEAQANLMATAVEMFQPRERTETARFNIELKLLDAAYKIRNHAQASDWSDEHTEALEAVGDALLNECGWEEERIHSKLREIVESIEGLQYGDG